ncbi:MAG: 4Fe-4S binding protein [Peptococcaceae bacterium]|nr:4Fe-4S binding protein [Peptococcaceae bacterium]
MGVLTFLKQLGNTGTNDQANDRTCRYRIDAEVCRGCGRCKKVCRAGAIRGERGRAHAIDAQICKGCASCVRWCRVKAIHSI